MILEENRLKTYTVEREAAGTRATSGLRSAATPATLSVQLDLQMNARPVDETTGANAGVRGPLTAFTYDSTLLRGDLIKDTAWGNLRVLGAMLWDDEDPEHYEVSLEVAA